MRSEMLGIVGAFLLNPPTFKDDRGTFTQTFQKNDVFETIGIDFNPVQVNVSTSRKGVLRGIHYAEPIPGQAKYLTVSNGSILDFIVDLRVDSPSFGEWISLVLEAGSKQSLFIDSGLGHAFLSLEENTTVTYLVDQEFNPMKEHSINPFDSSISLKFPLEESQLVISNKDKLAPSFEEQRNIGNLTHMSASRFNALNQLGDGN